jgi:hypothetical protein
VVEELHVGDRKGKQLSIAVKVHAISGVLVKSRRIVIFSAFSPELRIGSVILRYLLHTPPKSFRTH